MRSLDLPLGMTRPAWLLALHGSLHVVPARAQVAAADKGLLELWRQAGLLTMPQVGWGRMGNQGYVGDQGGVGAQGMRSVAGGRGSGARGGTVRFTREAAGKAADRAAGGRGGEGTRD